MAMPEALGPPRASCAVIVPGGSLPLPRPGPGIASCPCALARATPSATHTFALLISRTVFATWQMSVVTRDIQVAIGGRPFADGAGILSGGLQSVLGGGVQT